MEPKQRLFIYDRKEIGVLILLGLMVALFAFTLGVHLGKKVAPKSVIVHTPDAAPAQTVPDEEPSRQEVTDQAKAAPQAMDESVNQALHDEVARTGIKMDTGRQVELPVKPKSKNGGATTAIPDAEGTPEEAQRARSAEAPPALGRSMPQGRFTLQIGSFPSLNDARDQLESLEGFGLKPVVKQADLGHKGKWFRIFVGGFESKEDAERAGIRYKEKYLIKNYIVTRLEG